MTDQFTSLPVAALKDIVTHLDESIQLMENHKGRMSASEIQVKSMLSAVRRQLQEHIAAKEGKNPPPGGGAAWS
ncbi:MAG TPA: hypothetical protein VG734_09110 [Lacunisphaera sp.]|nr:hypothetical protein [Lacunisphaera sp.]